MRRKYQHNCGSDKRTVHANKADEQGWKRHWPNIAGLNETCSLRMCWTPTRSTEEVRVIDRCVDWQTSPSQYSHANSPLYAKETPTLPLDTPEPIRLAGDYYYASDRALSAEWAGMGFNGMHSLTQGVAKCSSRFSVLYTYKVFFHILVNVREGL